MAEIQDISQESEAVNTAPTETVSTGTDGTQVANITPEPKYRKKVYDVLKNNIYKDDPTNFKLTEQQFYKKIDSDQEYAKKVYSVLKSELSSDEIVQDESKFLSKLYEKEIKKTEIKLTDIMPGGTSKDIDWTAERVAAAKEAVKSSGGPAEFTVSGNGKGNGSKVIVYLDQKGNVQSGWYKKGLNKQNITSKAEEPKISTEVDKKTKFKRVAGYKEFKEVNPEFTPPTLTESEKTEFRKSDERKTQLELESQPQLATVSGGFRFDISQTKNDAYVLNGWDNLYNQYNDIAEKYGEDDESLVNTPSQSKGPATQNVVDKYLKSENNFKIPGINPATGQSEFLDQTVQSTNKSILERNAIRAQYRQKINEVADFIDKAVRTGINEFNYEDYLTVNKSGFSVPSDLEVRRLAKRIISTYTGKELEVYFQDNSAQALEEMFVGGLKAYISVYSKAKKSKEEADKIVLPKIAANIAANQTNVDATLIAKNQELYTKAGAEVKEFNSQLMIKRDAEITTMMAPILKQGEVINENLEKMTNDFKESTTFDKAVAAIPEIRNAKFNYEIAVKSLSNGQYTQQQADKIAKEEYDKYVAIVTPLYNQWQEGLYKEYQTAFEAERQKIVTMYAQAEIEAGRIATRYDNQSKAFIKQKNEQVDNNMKAFTLQMQKDGADPKLIKEWGDIYNKTFARLNEEEKRAINDKYYADMAFTGPFASLVATTTNGFADALVNYGIEFNSPFLKYVGESFSNTYSIPDLEIKSLKDITDMVKLTGSFGQVLGRQIPMLITAAIPGVGEEVVGGKIVSWIANTAISGTVGFVSETADQAGGMYRRVLAETGDPVKANLASWEIIHDNKKLWWTYAFDAIPYVHSFKNVIKGTGLTSMFGKFALRGGIEGFTEVFLQEWHQSSSEDYVYYKYVKGANNITTYDMMFTENKIIRDKYNNPLTDSKDGRGFYLTTGGLSRLKSIALNIGPASFLMGGSGSVLEYSRYKYSEQVGKNMFAKNALNQMSDSFHKQQIFQILLNRGKNTAAGYLVALNRSGKLSTEEFANLSQSLEEMEGYSKMAKRQRWKPEKTMAMAALNFEVSNINSQMQNAELTDQEKDMLSKRLDYAKRNLDDFVQGKKADYVVISIGNQPHILTYAQFDDMMADNDFVENTKGTIGVAFAGSKINSKGENIEEKAIKVFELQKPNQEQIDELERNGPPVMEVFANTEIPHLNNLVYDLEERMNNAEEIDEKDMNSAISGLYEQLQNILDNHYNTENGKKAAQMLMDTIEKFEDYEFTTKEETVDVTERTTTQSIREVVNATKNIFGRLTGTAKSGAKKFARITTGFKQQGKYSVEINEKDEVVLTPMSGAPIVLGSRKDLNGKVRFVGSSFSNKTGKISTITFRVNEANENGVMPEVTLSTADGFTYDELLDMAIDLRAMEVGEVTTEEFDNAVEEVTSGKKTVKTFPNIGKAEQKEKAKKEAEAQQQAAPEQAAPQATQEQITQEVQRLQAQQDEEMKAAQDMIKPSNLAKSGMTLNEALKARDEKVKQIKSKYKVLIDNAKKGVTQETQQAEQEQQVQENNEVMDITSANIDELQNIPTDNKFQQRVLNAIPNILKALSKIVPGIKVSVHLTTKSYRNQVIKDTNGRNDGKGTLGNYNPKTNTINIDLSRVSTMDGLVTVFHESFHGMYQKLTPTLQKILYKSIQTIIIRDGFRFKIKTRSYFDKFAKEYKHKDKEREEAIQQEEAVVEFLGYMASGGVTLTVPGYKMFMEALNKILDKIGMGSFKFTTSNQVKDFAKGVVNAMKTGQDISELAPEIVQGQNGLTQQEEMAFRSAVKIMKGLEKLTKYGLDEKRNKTRKVAEALEKRQREITGIIDRDDRSPEAMKKISSWMAEEVRHSLETQGENSGKGWYGEFFQKGLDEMGAVFPELKTDKNARDLFTMLVAVTSDGEKVFSNFRLAAKAYAYYRENGKMPDSIGGNRANIDEKVILIGSLLNQYNNDIPALVKTLTAITTITEINKKRKKQGLEELSSDWPVAFKIPAAAAYFGPKLGMFYANLMGNEKYPTLDRWWSRSFNRYRGTLLPVLKRFEERADGTLVKIGIELFKEKILGDPNATDEQAIGVAIELRNSYEAKGYKNPTDGEETANTIYKTLFENINDAPFNGGDRMFMYDTIVMAQKKLKNTGQNLSIADIQAILWYFEKRLYKELGVRGKIEGVSYKEAAKSNIEKFNEFGTWDFPEKKKSNKKGKSDEDSLNDGAEKENNEEGNNISFRNETANLFEQANNLKEKMAEAENTAEKRKFASERREMLSANPSVKLIDDNFKSIIDQLKNNEDFEFKGPCF